MIGKVVWNTGHVPVLSSILNFLGTKFGFVLLILLPILIITAGSIRDFTQEYKKELKHIRDDAYSKESITEKQQNSNQPDGNDNGGK